MQINPTVLFVQFCVCMKEITDAFFSLGAENLYTVYQPLLLR